MKTITTSDMLSRLEACDDPTRLEHYADPANVREARAIGGGHLCWQIVVKGFQGGRFVIADGAGQTEPSARNWACEVRRRAAVRLEELAVMA